MGLPLYALLKLKPYLQGAKVLSLSYPDILIRHEEIEKRFGFKVEGLTNQNIRHRVKFELPETFEVFEKLGASFECVDITKVTGREKIVDLNYPVDLGKYDIVIDPGTLEHCFNIGQAMMNCAQAVKSGGRVFHISPVNMVNHGFYNICPTLMHDFYGQNGWEIETLEMLNASKIKYTDTGRFGVSMEYILCCMARRKTEAALKFPTQHKYLQLLEKVA